MKTVKAYDSSNPRYNIRYGGYVARRFQNVEESAYANIQAQTHTFGVDSKGRIIGCTVTTFRVKYTETTKEDPASLFSFHIPGGYWCFTAMATRNGNRFGAGQGPRYFASEADRDAGVAEYLKNAQKRSAKK